MNYRKIFVHAISVAIVCIALVGLIVLTANAQTIEEAKKLFEAKNYEQAEEVLKQLRKQNDKDPIVHLYLGKVYKAMGKLEKAEGHLNKAVDRDKNLADGYYELGKLQLDKPRSFLDTKIKEAQRYFEKALKADPLHAETKFALYESYFENNEPQKASEILWEYLTENPNSTKGYMAYARMQNFYQYNVKTRCVLLRDIYARAFNTNPEDPEDTFEIGWGLFLSDDLQSARLAYNRAEYKAKDISYDKYLDMMTVAYENLSYGTAREYFEKGYEKIPLEKRSMFTNTKELPDFLVRELAIEYEVTPEQFVDPAFIPENQMLYLKQLYHYAVMWLSHKSEFERLKPISYTGKDLFALPYLLHAGLHNHLDFAFYYLLGEDERAEFLSSPNQHERAAWRDRWFRRRDTTPTNDKDELKEEFLQRVDFVYEVFKILPNRFKKEWHAKEFIGYDDRGKVWLKYGQPWHEYIDYGGTKNAETMDNPFRTDRRYVLESHYPQTDVKENRSWTYLHIDSYLAFDFVEMNDGYFTYVEDLGEAIIGGMNAARLYLNEDRAEIGGAYMVLYESYRKLLNLIDTRDESLKLLDEETLDELFTKGYRDLMEIPDFNHSEFLWDMLIPEVSFKNEVVETYPTNIVDINKPRRRLPMHVDWATFKGEEGKTRVEVYTAVEYRNLDFNKEADDKLLASLDYDVVVKDKEVLPVEENNASNEILLDTKKSKLDMSLINWFTFNLSPEQYFIFVKGENIQGEKESTIEIETTVRNYHVDELIASDIQLSLDIVPASERDKFVKHGLSVIPYPFRRVQRSKKIHIYYEIYNLAQRPNGTTSYDINYTINLIEPNNTMMEALKTLFPGRKGQAETSSRVSRSGAEKDAVEHIAFDIENLMPGKAELIVEIIDKVGGKSTFRFINFELF